MAGAAMRLIRLLVGRLGFKLSLAIAVAAYRISGLSGAPPSFPPYHY